MRGAWPQPDARDGHGYHEYVGWLADEGRTLSTITAYLAAIASAHGIAKHPFDRSALKDDLKGIRRVRKRAGGVDMPKGYEQLDMRGILSSLGSSAIDARDRLLLALGFAAALRRSELVGLDWKRQGTGEGYLTQDHRGIVITLLSTKGGKGEPVEVIVPCAGAAHTPAMRSTSGPPSPSWNRGNPSFARSSKVARRRRPAVRSQRGAHHQAPGARAGSGARPQRS